MRRNLTVLILIAPDGKLYRLSTSRVTGVEIDCYALR
jgi:hypothetical protein